MTLIIAGSSDENEADLLAYLGKAHGKLMQYIVQSGRVEHRQVTEVVLRPGRLSLYQNNSL